MSEAPPDLRIAVHIDAAYHEIGGEIFGEHAFTRFIVQLAEHTERLVLLGRLDPDNTRARYALGPRITFIALPFYEDLAHVTRSAAAMLRALRVFWRALGPVDVVCLFGPHPMQLAFAVLAATRGRRLVLGVRQDFPSYVAARHRSRVGLRLAAIGLEAFWRILARRVPTVVVGPELAEHYRRSRSLLEITATLVSDAEVVSPDSALPRSYDDVIEILSVGRIEAEKNPMLMIEVLSLLARDGRGGHPRWRLTIVGEGPMEQEMRDRLESLGVGGLAQLTGYVPYGSRLRNLYRNSHMLLHVSWTEGLPQVLVEAFAAGIPVVATDVGGIRQAFPAGAVLIPPGNAQAAADAIRRLAGDSRLRERLIRAGHVYVNGRTIEGEASRVADFVGQGM